MATLLITDHLGSTLEMTSEPCRINIKNDGVTVLRAPNGTLHANATAAVRHVVDAVKESIYLKVTYSDATVEFVDICCERDSTI